MSQDTGNKLQKIKQGIEHGKIVQWPGTEEDVKLTLLSEDAKLKAVLSADKAFKDSNIGLENARAYDSEVETQELFRSVKDPEKGTGLTNSIVDFRSLMTPETKDFLAEELANLHDEHSPDLFSMDDDEFDALMKDLKKKPEETAGSVLSLGLARRLILSLVFQLRNSQQDNGSTS